MATVRTVLWVPFCPYLLKRSPCFSRRTLIKYKENKSKSLWVLPTYVAGIYCFYPNIAKLSTDESLRMSGNWMEMYQTGKFLAETGVKKLKLGTYVCNVSIYLQKHAMIGILMKWNTFLSQLLCQERKKYYAPWHFSRIAKWSSLHFILKVWKLDAFFDLRLFLQTVQVYLAQMQCQCQKWFLPRPIFSVTLIGMRQGGFTPLIIYGFDFVSWFFIINFQTFLKMKI